MRYLLISLLFLSSCQIDKNEPKKIEIEGTSYYIYKASDSCEYYAIKTKINYVEKSEYYHYAQCAWCKKEK
jgi:hypothetical protein